MFISKTELQEIKQRLKALEGASSIALPAPGGYLLQVPVSKVLKVLLNDFDATAEEIYAGTKITLTPKVKTEAKK